MRLFGLIGYPLSHSFSKKYFSAKFEKEQIHGCRYELFPIIHIGQLPEIIRQHPDLVGLNVTIPYKQQVLNYLESIHEEAAAVGAVNTICIREGKLSGFNSDVYGFGTSLENLLKPVQGAAPAKALVLGSGGAAKAVWYVLEKKNIPYITVSRSPGEEQISYQQLDKGIMEEYRLIINTTPLGMAPKTDACPDIPYHLLGSQHALFDLVYNPEKTLFLARGAEQGARIQNGLEMLHLQAERSWEIWNNPSQ